jgi:Protein of unknown function (DUF1501)
MAWSTVVIGGAIQGGQVIGRTDQDGQAVEERPVPLVEKQAQPIQELI